MYLMQLVSIGPNGILVKQVSSTIRKYRLITDSWCTPLRSGKWILDCYMQKPVSWTRHKSCKRWGYSSDHQECPFLWHFTRFLQDFRNTNEGLITVGKWFLWICYWLLTPWSGLFQITSGRGCWPRGWVAGLSLTISLREELWGRWKSR